MTNLFETQTPSESQPKISSATFNQLQPALEISSSGGGESGEESPMSTSTTNGEDVTSSPQLTGDDSERKSDVDSTTVGSTNSAIRVKANLITDLELSAPHEEPQSSEEIYRELQHVMSSKGEQDQLQQDSGGEGQQSVSPLASSPSRVPVLTFPLSDMARLDEMISNPRWVVPVLPGGHLEKLLAASIDLAKRGLDEKCEPCQRFYRDGLTISFTKILTDDAVSSWKPEIHKAILKNCERLVDLMVVKLRVDWFPLFDLMSTLFNPTNKFHMFNANRPPETYSPDAPVSDDELFARPIEMRQCKGWLVDLINRFGSEGGFDLLLKRFKNPTGLNVGVIFSLIRPFGRCAEFLTRHSVEKYFTYVLRAVPQILENLSDDELKKETAKSDVISSVIKCLKALQTRSSESEEQMKTLELFRLRMILRMLQVSSFNGKMNALNEINQVIQNVTSHYTSHHYRLDEVEYLTAKNIADWFADNQVLQIVLRDSLHQPQYVEKLEKILRFIIKERSLSLKDLDDIWACQVGKHDTIVKNVHDLLAKLAWDFSPEQLDHLFECFQTSWTTANKRQREKLLELIRRLAEDDKDGVMAYKVLTLFWNLAQSTEVPTEIMDQALTAHVKVLDYSCSQQRDNQKFQWLNKSMDKLIEDDVNWVIPAMKHMNEIFSLYPESSSANKNAATTYRAQIINKLQNDRQLIVKVCESLNSYMEKVRIFVKEKGAIDPHQVKLDGRYSHLDQIKERLTFLLSLLKAGDLCLCEEQAVSIWQCLAENPAFPSDREMCFEWFSKLMQNDYPDLDSNIIQLFFERKILNFDPTLLTECGLECFERFFKFVNIKQKKLIVNKRDEISMDDLELTGTDYVWKIILSGSEDMASKAIYFLRQICTALGPKLLPNQIAVHDDFLSSCADRLKASYDTILVLEKDKDSTNRVRQEVTRACRVLRVLFEYIVECDNEYGEERGFIPLYRSSRGRNFVVYIRFPGPSGRGFEDMEVLTHTNETPAGLRRQIIHQVKEQMQITSGFKLDVFYNGEIIDLSDDRRNVHQFGLRDKMVMQAKLVHSNVPNSPDSSEESSGGSPNHFTGGSDGPNTDAEESLPSVMMSMTEARMTFLCKLCELGANIGDDRMRDAARHILSAVPPCRYTVKTLRDAFLTPTSSVGDKKPYNVLFNTDPPTVLYRLEVLYALLFPASQPQSSQTIDLLQKFFIAGGASMVVEMLTKNNFMPLADTSTKRLAYLAVLRLTKAILTITLHVLYRYESEGNTPARSERLRTIAEAVKAVPNISSESTLRQTADRVSHTLFNFWKSSVPDVQKENLKILLVSAVEGSLPDLETIKLLIKLASLAATGSLAYMTSEQHQANRELTENDIGVCEEALESLTLSFVLNPGALDQILNEPMWKSFVRQVLFLSHSISVRSAAAHQFYSIATKCTGNYNALTFFILFLFEIIQSTVRDMPQNSYNVFHLLCNLLRYSHNVNVPLPGHERMLATQIDWLRQAKEYVKRHGEGYLQDDLLEGHISVAKELTNFLTSEKKYELGSGSDPNQTNASMIKEILEEFVFPWSKAFSNMRKTGEISFKSPVQICSTPSTQTAILELVVSLCSDCCPNMKLTVDILTQLFGYCMDGEGILNEWEYYPPVGSRPMGGFVGLKNAGATCYMNSVLQQLFMVENIKRGVLGVTVTDVDPSASGDVSDEVVGRDSTDSVVYSQTSHSTLDSNSDDRKSYNVCILKQIQSIFGHLALSKFQYHIPSGLWKHFRLQGEPVNLREQQDAVEFFMSLVESVDDGLKALGEEQVMSKNLGGLFSDQKICKECPHRYSKEEPFSVISVDIRNHSNLLDSLEQYVKGELLEGADAYHCERCNKKVMTVKRLCVKKLPPVLAIQLKRFEYDYERVCPIKFNDYFEFPRELDMEPYTVSGLAKIEGEMIDQDDAALLGQNLCTKYRLTGIVVHSGQASGGHYYSYISFKCQDGMWRWYKFDDGDVSECRMDDDEELKNQCFGGDYSGEVFDHMMKRMSLRRQKRWWNAYILFYTRVDVVDTGGSAKFSSLPYADRRLKMPAVIEKNVLKQNVEFMHVRSHFSPEYFQFVKKLVSSNHGIMPTEVSIEASSEEMEQLALLSVQMAIQFLFSIGFRTKKNLRGSTNDWYEYLMPYIRVSKTVRFWLATNALFVDSCRFSEYLLECPSSEVRQTFSKLLIYLCHTSNNDGPYIPTVPMVTLSRRFEREGQLWEYILESILHLVRRELSEFGRHVVQYFGFFVSYAGLGDTEKANLLKLEVPETFMMLALEDGPAPPIKYQCADLSKLHQTVSLLVRSCDVTHLCKAALANDALKPNPFKAETVSGDPILVLPKNLEETIYRYGDVSCSPYIKKIIDEAYTAEDTVMLLQFLCWENFKFSEIAIMEILIRIGYSYTTDVKAFLDLLVSLLRIDDSWQSERIACALKGLPEDKDGLIDIILRSKTSHPKRAYLFIKCVTNLMEPNSIAHNVLLSVPELMAKWYSAVDWLQHELERRAPACTSAYGYSTTSWSPPSNESSNGSFFLERSLSAKHTLDRALELRIDPDQGDNEESPISSEGEENKGQTAPAVRIRTSNVAQGRFGRMVPCGYVAPPKQTAEESSTSATLQPTEDKETDRLKHLAGKEEIESCKEEENPYKEMLSTDLGQGMAWDMTWEGKELISKIDANKLLQENLKFHEEVEAPEEVAEQQQEQYGTRQTYTQPTFATVGESFSKMTLADSEAIVEKNEGEEGGNEKVTSSTSRPIEDENHEVASDKTDKNVRKE